MFLFQDNEGSIWNIGEMQGGEWESLINIKIILEEEHK